MALTLVLTGPAFAQCAPEPTQANGTTTCTGTDPNGVTVTTSGTTVSVPIGATVLGGGRPGIAVQAPATGFGSGVTVTVAGRVDGGAQAGVSVQAQPSQGFSTANIALTVAQGGTVTGNTALTVGQAAAGSSYVYATVDNAGTLTGTSGIALQSTTPTFAGFSTITNRATGTIGAISGPVGTLTNAGTIDGGVRGAVDMGTGGLFNGSVTNSGTIASTSTVATVANLGSFRAVMNSGTIANRGTGAALTGENLSITNASGGRITSAGATAIQSNTYLTLTNAGTITGNVITASQPSYVTGSTIDSSSGTIAGSVTFGVGDDTLIAGWNGTGLVTGITGAINGAAGTDTLRVKFTADATIARTIVLPTNFERVSLAPDTKVTTTLADGFNAPGPILIGGSGTVINRTTIVGATQAVAVDSASLSSPTFVNAGTIVTTAGRSGVFALGLGFSINRFENSGTITATGDGVDFGSQGRFLNSGTITAAGTGVSLFGPYFTNSGTIRSTGGIGVILSGSYGSDWTNSGRIEGATAGARVSSTLINTGTIASAATGVQLDYYGVLVNRAGGIVTGGTAGIAGTSNSMFGAAIVNAGTINGNVRLVGASISNYNPNRYFAVAGGVLNGSLTLGTGDTLITELVNRGSGAFAGITGSVTGSGTQLRYRVRSDAAGTLGLPTGFVGVGYDLYDDATLTLTGTASQSSPTFFTPPLMLAGRGTVDLNGTIAATSQPAILVTSLLIAPGETSPTSSGLAITSRGALTLDHPNDTNGASSAVVLSGNDSFTNTGTITVRDRATTISNPIYAISGGKAVVNSGTITLTNAGGVTNAPAFTNSGAIIQTAGISGTAAVNGIAALTNSGTIDSTGAAVLLSYGNSIVNSGRIASSGGPAIATVLYSTTYNAAITNQAGGTIRGAAGQAAIQIAGGTLSNAGTIAGSVDLGYATNGRSFLSATYIADGGTLAGDLRFGSGDDVFIATDGVTGVSGTIDGGQGIDTFVHARTTSGTVTLGAPTATSFEREGARAQGAGTTVTIAAAAPFATDVVVSGDGAIVNTATIRGQVYVRTPDFGQTAATARLASFTNAGGVDMGFAGAVGSIVNTGTIGTNTLAVNAVASSQNDTLAFSNSGTILNNGRANPVSLGASSITFGNSGAITSGGNGIAASLFSYAGGAIAATNSGTITGGFDASSYGYAGSDTAAPATASVSLVNSGTITRARGTAVDLYAGTYGTAGSVSLTNTGTIEATGSSGTGALVNAAGDGVFQQTINVVNSGTIRANGSASVALILNSNSPATAPVVKAVVVNAATGVIEATGPTATALLSYDAGIDLTNAGTIKGSAGTVLAADNPFALYLGTSYVAGAIQTGGSADDRIVNTGTIIGSVALGEGSDTIENRGRIEGNVFLGAGDDTLLQLASATLVGTVDGGVGLDSLVVDATGGGAVNGDQFVNFERFSQVGQGNVAYSGNFRFDTIGVGGSNITVAAGQTLTSTGPVTLTGTGAAETVINNGSIAGSVALLGGNDRFVNNGSVGGAVSLGDGDDEFVEGAGSRVAGGVDGGAGSDLYTVVLAGDRTGLGARTGFERLGVMGTGALSLTLDQSFDTVVLTGTGLNVTLAGRSIGAVTGSAAADTLAVDGDIASVSLGAGDDTLALGTTRAAGRYDGGAGTDTLRVTAATPVTLAGTATGFEQLVLAGNALIVTGTLGSTGAALAFGAGDQQLKLANGGTLAGTIDLGAGNDSFRLAATGTLIGTVAGGAGTDVATIELAGNRTIGGELTGFETLATEGTGILSLTGTSAYDRVTAATDLTVVVGAALTAPQVQFGAANNRFTIAGGFVGSVDGGAGTDTIAVSGGSEAAPVAFGSVANVENFAMSGGFATVSGTAAFGSVDLSGGRIVGLAGSTIGGSFLVRQGATFGSAGTINGNLTIAGTLSPGASPGTMTVNGNVAIQSGSVSLFEITPTVSDKLVVNGAVSIASGATLQLVPSGSLRPGTSYDLIVATGGITGGYTTIVKPDTLFGFVVQRADRIQLLGQFLNDAAFSPQVTGSIAYANATLSTAPATSPLFAALPALLTTGGASNPTAFAQLTPEAYASASQIGVDNALALAGTARGAGFGTDGEDAHAFTFAQTLGGWHRLDADPAAGTSTARSRSYGFVGGVGIGSAAWSIGGFAGYLNDRQQIDTLDARTKLDGVVAGVHGRYQAPAGFGLTASILYDGGTARTNRALPGTAAASGRYDLHSWVGDVAIGYDMAVASDWTLRPRAGITYVRTTRDGVTETGGSPFALTVGRDRHVAGFADGGLSFSRAETSAEPFRPFVSLGVRYQLEGTRTDAVAGYAGGGLGLGTLGAARSRMVGTAAAGVGYRLPSGLDLFASAGSQTGRDDHQETVTAGVRLRF
ncbi:autotransporter outer membrane beta-barrel domain-containing protein [Sphingomonas sp. R86521]|uniref:autotransporter outer membrane beta-barrel domain-containing protein n=1 Tax=Sphingomonas sp. R86521 TaxID=3093860 RepID=UPI0036D3FFE5